MDVLTSEQRSFCMARIHGKNTKPELQVRRALFRRGLRYRLHRQDLPGSPDIVFSRFRAVLFINGCFWHGHKCRLYKVPETNRDFWLKKIRANRKRDRQVSEELRRTGWRTLTVWECAVRGRHHTDPGRVAEAIHGWLGSTQTTGEISSQAKSGQPRTTPRSAK